MKKLFPLFLLFFQMLPALQPWVPQIVPACAACEATGHELCANANHHCAEMDTPAVEEAPEASDSCCASEPEPKTEIGHKCPAAQYQQLADMNSRFVYHPVEAAGHSTLSVPFQSFFPIFTARVIDRGIDHPPSVLL